MSRFGRLQVLSVSRSGGRLRAVCSCDCGTVKSIRMDALTSGATVSCGCYSAEQTAIRNTVHGLADTAAYRTWHAMMNRCYRADNDNFGDYGGRGIRVCDRWHDVELFSEDMGHPAPGQHIDRIDNDGDYQPGNCRWVTPAVNMNNRRNTPMATHCGETLSLADWARRIGIKYPTIVSRIRRGWSIERALSTKEKSCS